MKTPIAKTNLWFIFSILWTVSIISFLGILELAGIDEGGDQIPILNIFGYITMFPSGYVFELVPNLAWLIPISLVLNVAFNSTLIYYILTFATKGTILQLDHKRTLFFAIMIPLGLFAVLLIYKMVVVEINM